MKKIAYVDIDGTLIISRKESPSLILNPELVKRLKTYDEIVLITQRCALIRIPTIKRLFGMDNPHPEDLISTKQAVTALQVALGSHKPIRVSTSVDQHFGNPTQYYQETFENLEDGFMAKAIQRKQEAEEKDDAEPLDIQPIIKTEITKIRQTWQEVYGETKPVPEDDLALVPNDKKMQFITLTQYLLANYPQNTGAPKAQIDFYDDNFLNLQEVNADLNKRSPEEKPYTVNYFWAVGTFIFNPSSIAAAYERPDHSASEILKMASNSNDETNLEKKNNQNKRWLLYQLYEYIRENPPTQHSEVVKTFCPTFFLKADADIAKNKRSAAEKLIGIIKNDPSMLSDCTYDSENPYMDFSPGELVALRNHRLEPLLKTYLPKLYASLPESENFLKVVFHMPNSSNNP